MKVNISAKSDTGLERTNNEDAFVFCQDLNRQNWDEATHGYIPTGDLGSFAAVADGMGGANAGETASNIALDTIKNAFRADIVKSVVSSEQDICAYIREVIKKAHEAIMQHVNADPDTIGMGTTIVLLWMIRGKAFIAWCGDSRCYVYNPRKGMHRLSKDHSLVQELIDKGEITVNESYERPDGNIITRCLGDTDSSSDPDLTTYVVRPDDTFLLCSDGLCGYCRDKTIRKTLYSSVTDVDKCSDALIDISLKRGGYDNVTVVLLSAIDDNSATLRIPFLSKIRNWFA